MTDPVNAGVAARLDEVAALLEEQGANPFRVAAYRRAAQTLRALPTPVADVLRNEGMEGLRSLPGVGTSLARSIRQVITGGRLPMLERLRGETNPEAVLMTVPGIGRTLAAQLHRELGIASLTELEAAANDGRLHDLAGLGHKRIAAICDVLASRLSRVWRATTSPSAEEPAVSELLDVDREYRHRAQAGTLPKIAPRRFNPAGEAWLPVLHTRAWRERTARCFPTPCGHTGWTKPATG